jgi:hypothetical protein
MVVVINFHVLVLYQWHALAIVFWWAPTYCECDLSQIKEILEGCLRYAMPADRLGRALLQVKT